MNYSRGIQPSCCSKEEYYAKFCKHWYKLEDKKPFDGQCVMLMMSDGTNDHDFWSTTEAVYYAGNFFEPIVRDVGLTYHLLDSDYHIEGWSQPVSMEWDIDE